MSNMGGSYLDNEYREKVYEFADSHHKATREEAIGEFLRCCEEIDELTKDDTPREVIREEGFRRMKSVLPR